MLSVPVMRQVLGDTLRGIGLNEESVTDILLAATEACTNVVLHAGQSAAAYTVAATVDDAACRVEVSDAGRGCRAPRAARRRVRRAHGAAESGAAESAAEAALSERDLPDHAALAESGRGFAIMSACVDEVTLRSAPGQGTSVMLAKRIALDPPLA
jgi:serine/threonine-protein kinase RsbW